MSTKKNEVAINEEEMFSSAQLPAHLQGKMEQGRGSEDVSSDDLTIPRIQIIQALSPQKKKTHAKYIEGAEEGMAFNTATEELFTDGLYVIPVYFRKEFLIWTAERSADTNGFHGSYPTEAAAVEALKALPNRAELEIVDTHQQFVLIIDPAKKTAQEAVISMAKSQIKVSKRLNTQLRMAGGDRFAHVLRFSVVDDKSEKGEYYSWTFKKVGYAPEWAYALGESMYEAVKSGAKSIDMNDAKGSAPSAGGATYEHNEEMEDMSDFPDEM
ncbi:hypothetical protein J3_0031 [Vibrio phage J3]|nr:hypothetical protein H1_0031 [Vibrio phage H1]AIZ01670.1 hypothetical protein J3_0031 [Vibrio phage J3]